MAGPDPGTRLPAQPGGPWIVPALLAVFEGSWIAVVAAAVGLFANSGAPGPPASLGLLASVLAAGAGVAVARRPGRMPPRPWQLILAAVGIGAAAWLAAPGVPEGLFRGDVGPALAFNAGGWLAGVAFLRGTRYADPAGDDLRVATALPRLLAVLAVPWLAAGLGSEPGTAWFVDIAYPATILMVASGLLAIGFARLRALELDGAAGPDRRWITLLGLVVGGVVVVGLLAAPLLGLPIAQAGALLLGPAAGLLVLLVGVLVQLLEPVIRVLVSLLPPPVRPQLPDTGATGQGNGAGEATPPDLLLVVVVVVVAVILAVVAAAMAFFLARYVLGHLRIAVVTPVELGATIDRRSRVAPVRGRPRPAGRGPQRRRRRTGSAADAYLDLVDDLAGAGRLARLPTESPRRHAQRLRGLAAEGGAPFEGPGLGLLAADFQLETYASRTVSEAERRRAFARLRRLREELRRQASRRAPAP